ncbi:hypothetical protein [Spirulina subsalsa]|uniref:hypothetical protein n=1 Tax=Spirulina subsalsa TaxID=54311 RepID=UPI0002E642FD|nr:hypothetical protein [Spirulina subsalsa]
MAKFPFKQISNWKTAEGQAQPSLEPLGDATTPAGYTAPVVLQTKHFENLPRLGRIAHQVLNEPSAIRKVGDRVYELMEEDLRSRRERSQF